MLSNNFNILIIDSRKELSVKYKRLIEHRASCTINIEHTAEKIIEYTNKFEPDLIIISDSIQEPTNEICCLIRSQIKEYRPVIVILSKSSHIDDKIINLTAGADDFISEPIENEEFIARILAHLRRSKEENMNHLTHIASSKTLLRILKRTLNSRTPWSAMLIDIDYFKQYQDIYGDLAANKMLQTYSAIIKTTLDDRDILTHLENDSFVVITAPEQAAKIASLLKFAFDKVANRFYTKEDAQKGYITMFSDATAGRRIPLVTTSIGIISNEYRHFATTQDILCFLITTHKLAKAQAGSFIVQDTLQLSGTDAVNIQQKNKVLIIEKDAAMAYLISSTLEMQGYQTQAISNYQEVLGNLNEFCPDVVVLDAAENNAGTEICRQIKETTPNIKIIVSSVMHDKDPILSAGADLYLPKPYDILVLHSWIKRFLDI
jgi:diguanylate cyclase (GGDEF)-like protein